MKRLFSRIGIIFLESVAWLPHSILYAISTGLHFFLQYIIRYRKRVIETNISKAFPDIKSMESRQIQSKYYQHLSRLIVEFFISLRADKKFFQQHIYYKNQALIQQLYDKKKPLIILLAHCGNFEWLCLSSGFLPFENFLVYKKINDSVFNNWIKKSRSKFGGNLVEINELAKVILQNKNKIISVSLIADQIPVDVANADWTMFLHQETAFYKGAERLAKLLNAEIVYAKVLNEKKGYYSVEFLPLNKMENITKQYAEQLSAQIHEQPYNWLWSHKRWKRKRPENTPLLS